MSDFKSELIVENCPLFRDLDRSAILALTGLMHSAAFDEGNTILQEGGVSQGLFVLVKGTCAVEKHTKKGGHPTLAMLEPGNVFGEMSFVKPAPHSATIVAQSEVHVLSITEGEFLAFAKAHPTAAVLAMRNIAAVAVQRLRQMDEWVGELLDRTCSDNHKAEWQEFRAKLFNHWQF